VRLLRPHEDVVEGRVRGLADQILLDGFIRYPILVDSRTLVVLDGHHRLAAAKLLGLRFIPAILVDYDGDCVSVSSWRDGVTVTKDMVREHGLKGNLMPPKTSRHRVCFEVPEVRVPLEVLGG
jgi:ParB-like chromosome segregation protein Spo0J